MTKWEWLHMVLSERGPESPAVRLVLVALVLGFYNEVKACAWPSVATLAARTGHCTRTVQRALEEAETAGWLRRDAEPGQVTVYRPAFQGVAQALSTPDKKSPPPQTRALGPQTKSNPTPDKSAGDLRKEPGEEIRRKAGAPACPFCSAPLDRKAPKKGPFWGCSTFRGKGKGGCPFTCEVDDPRLGEWAELPAPMNQDALEKAAKTARPMPTLRVKESGEFEAALARKRAGQTPQRVDVGGVLAALRIGS